jgi:hypothetical protein
LTVWARISDAYDSFLQPAISNLFADGFEVGNTNNWSTTAP